jgi:hypothetical protein
MWFLSEPVQAFVVPGLCDLLTGTGLACLLEFSAVSPDAGGFVVIVGGSALAAALLAHLLPCTRPPPPWLTLCNSTFSLVLTLSVCLNLMAQLCPPTGRELALVPCYCLVCLARAPLTRAALAVQCGLGVALALAFAVVAAPRHARPDGTEALSVGAAAGLAQAVLLASMLSTFDPTDERVLYGNAGRAAAGGALLKGGLLLWLGCVRSTALYHFMFDRQSVAPYWLFGTYGALLVFASMQTAAQWFSQLKGALTRATVRTLVRMQHIMYALVVAAAWAFPLQLALLRQVLVALLLAANLVFRM